jgi:cell division protein FtsI/penicillin-binding protein 2
MMQLVVQGGTAATVGFPASLKVAGKTGTAELGPVTGKETGADTEQRLDAWFTAFAPASDPKLAVAAMVVNASGDGGTIAAPIVQQVMASALGTG